MEKEFVDSLDTVVKIGSVVSGIMVFFFGLLLKTLMALTKERQEMRQDLNQIELRFVGVVNKVESKLQKNIDDLDKRSIANEKDIHFVKQESAAFQRAMAHVEEDMSLLKAGQQNAEVGIKYLRENLDRLIEKFDRWLESKK